VLFASARNGVTGIYKQSLDGQSAQLLVTGTIRVDDGHDLSPDGKWLIYVLFPSQSNFLGPARVMRVPVNGGPSEFIFEAANVSGLRCAKSSEVLCTIGEWSADGKRLTITAFDPIGGRTRALYNDTEYIDRWDLTPDGSELAISRGRWNSETRIDLASLSGGGSRQILVKGSVNGMVWSPDAKGLYCGTHSAEGVTLLYVDTKGRANTIWQERGAFTVGLPSRDGRRLAIMGASRESNAWLIEGF